MEIGRSAHHVGYNSLVKEQFRRLSKEKNLREDNANKKATPEERGCMLRSKGWVRFCYAKLFRVWSGMDWKNRSLEKYA